MMAVENVTDTWPCLDTVGGLYVVRSANDWEDGTMRIRVGAGGNRSGANGLRGRLKAHGGGPPGEKAKYRNSTLDNKPWSVLRAWALPAWSKHDVMDGEHILYRHFLLHFRRVIVGDVKGDSIFSIPQRAELDSIYLGIEEDLRVMDRLVDRV